MSSIKIQFVWVTTTTQTLNIPDTSSMLTISSQINANISRVNKALDGTLAPKTGTGFPLSTATNKKFATDETLNANYTFLTLAATASNTDYIKKSFIKVTAPLHADETPNSTKAVPVSYTSVRDLKRLYTRLHPDFASTLKPYKEFQNDVLSTNTVIVFITNLTDGAGLPIPYLYDFVSTPEYPSTCIAISAWTLGDHTTTNPWVSDTTQFDRVPWCRNLRGGGALVSAIGSVLGLNSEFDSQCTNSTLHRYPNLYVTAYQDNKSNVTVNSNQLLYYGNPTILCTREVDSPYNIMDMASDDVRYFISPTQQVLINKMFPTTKDPNVETPTIITREPPPGLDMGIFFLALLVMWIILSLTIGQLISFWVASDSSIYYKYINPYGEYIDRDSFLTKDLWTKLFLQPLLLPHTEINPHPPATNEQIHAILANTTTSSTYKIQQLRLLGISTLEEGIQVNTTEKEAFTNALQNLVKHYATTSPAPAAQTSAPAFVQIAAKINSLKRMNVIVNTSGAQIDSAELQLYTNDKIKFESQREALKQELQLQIQGIESIKQNQASSASVTITKPNELTEELFAFYQTLSDVQLQAIIDKIQQALA